MKKAQIRMFETIMTLMIFFVILVIGFRFYAGMQQESLNSKMRELRQLEIVKLAESVKNLPELECSTNAVSQQDCFDLIKVQKLNELMRDTSTNWASTYYYDLFGYSNIVIEQIYPPPTVSYTIYDRQNEEMKRQKKSPTNRTVNMPIALYDPGLYDPVKRLTYFGVLTVRAYEYN